MQRRRYLFVRRICGYRSADADPWIRSPRRSICMSPTKEPPTGIEPIYPDYKSGVLPIELRRRSRNCAGFARVSHLLDRDVRHAQGVSSSLRVLVVSNMVPSADVPQYGVFVTRQTCALEQNGCIVEIEIGRAHV